MRVSLSHVLALVACLAVFGTSSESWAQRKQKTLQKKNGESEITVNGRKDGKGRLRKMAIDYKSEKDSGKLKLKMDAKGQVKKARIKHVDSTGKVHRDSVKCKKDPEFCRVAIQGANQAVEAVTAPLE